MNNRADFASLIILVLVIFIFSIVVVVFSKVFLSITTEIKTMPQISNNTLTAINKVETKTIPALDLFMLITLVGMIIGLIISSMYIESHPALAFVFFIGLIIATFLAIQFANIHSEITANSDLSSTASQFSFTNIIMGEAFPIIIFITGLIAIIIIYGKGRSLNV